MDEDLMLRCEIIKTGIELLKKGLIQGTGGNISAKTKDGFFLITPSGMDYTALSPEDIVTMDLDCNVVNGCRKPSIEKNMHKAILALRPDINAVVHTHSIYATSVAAARKPIPPITDNQVAVFGGTVPVSDYAPIGSEALARNAAAVLGKGYGALLANHGALCVGVDLKEALFRCEMLETFARIFILSQIAGGGITLNEEEIKKEAEDLNRLYGQG